MLWANTNILPCMYDLSVVASHNPLPLAINVIDVCGGAPTMVTMRIWHYDSRVSISMSYPAYDWLHGSGFAGTRLLQSNSRAGQVSCWMAIRELARVAAGWQIPGWHVAGWQLAGWPGSWLANNWLAVGWLTAGWGAACWLAGSWLAGR